MARVGTLHVDYAGAWNGYMNFHVIFDIVCTVTDDVQFMNCEVRNFTETHGGGWQSDGYGFINYGAICWNIPSHYSEHLTIPPNEAGPESISSTYNQILSVMPTLEENAIFGYGLSDKRSIASEKIFGWKFGHTFKLNGVLPKDMNVINGMTRWYRWDGYPMADRRAIIQTTSTFTINFEDINWDYRPWAIRKSNRWMSCNRDGGSLSTRKSSAWKEITNDSNAPEKSGAFVRKNNIWIPSPQIGDEK